MQRRLGSTSKFNASSSVVGLVFLESSLVYTLVASPIGLLADKYSKDTVFLKHTLGLEAFESRGLDMYLQAQDLLR